MERAATVPLLLTEPERGSRRTCGRHRSRHRVLWQLAVAWLLGMHRSPTTHQHAAQTYACGWSVGLHSSTMNSRVSSARLRVTSQMLQPCITDTCCSCSTDQLAHDFGSRHVRAGATGTPPCPRDRLFAIYTLKGTIVQGTPVRTAQRMRTPPSCTRYEYMHGLCRCGVHGAPASPDPAVSMSLKNV